MAQLYKMTLYICDLEDSLSSKCLLILVEELRIQIYQVVTNVYLGRKKENKV